MPLAIFDLDDTLLDGDSSSLFLRHLVGCGLAPADMLPREAAMMEDYHAGHLAMDDYMTFTLQPLRGRSVAEVDAWVDACMRETLLPRIFPEARATLAACRTAGRRLLVVSATGIHVVGPVARALGIDDALAIDLEIEDGRYTGRTTGTLTYRHGKVLRLYAWAEAMAENLADSLGYSDSINDVPLLETVSRAHVVNPGAELARLAAERGWARLDWPRTFSMPPGAAPA
jgi:HAD superfamily hydrolase (TIGR01490 family)